MGHPVCGLAILFVDSLAKTVHGNTEGDEGNKLHNDSSMIAMWELNGGMAPHDTCRRENSWAIYE